MGWKDALESVRAGLASWYPGAQRGQERSPPERGYPKVEDHQRVAACNMPESRVSSGVPKFVERHTNGVCLS